MFFNLPKKYYLFGFVFVIVIIVLVVFAFLYKNNSIAGLGGLQIELNSSIYPQAQNAKLAWKDKATLQKVFGEILTNAQNNKANKFNTKINKIVITLVSDKQDNLVTYSGPISDSNYLSSAKSILVNDTVYINVNIKESNTISSSARDGIVNGKAITAFMLVVPPSVGSGVQNYTGAPWSVYDYLTDIMKRYFSGSNYPIQVVNK